MGGLAPSVRLPIIDTLFKGQVGLPPIFIVARQLIFWNGFKMILGSLHYLWFDAIMMATYLDNYLPSSRLGGATFLMFFSVMLLSLLYLFTCLDAPPLYEVIPPNYLNLLFRH